MSPSPESTRRQLKDYPCPVTHEPHTEWTPTTAQAAPGGTFYECVACTITLRFVPDGAASPARIP